MKLVSDEMRRTMLIQEAASAKITTLRSKLPGLVDEKRNLQNELQRLTERLLKLEKEVDQINQEIASLSSLL